MARKTTSAAEHARRSRAARKAARTRAANHARRVAAARKAARTRAAHRRAAPKRRANPYDGHGFWHDGRGLYETPPSRGGRAATRRRAQTRKVAAGRKRTAAGAFRNPTRRPAARRRTPARDPRTGHFLPSGARPRRARAHANASYANRAYANAGYAYDNASYANPFYDKQGRRRRNDGTLMPGKKRGPAKAKPRKRAAAPRKRASAPRKRASAPRRARSTALARLPRSLDMNLTRPMAPPAYARTRKTRRPSSFF